MNRCKCGKTIARRSLRCHGCANKRKRPGRRVFDSDLPKEVYGRLSSVVRNAIARCTDETHSGWEAYGGRGITVQTDWLEDPAKFVQYLTTLLSWEDPTLVIDRIDNDLGYEEGNIRFVTRSDSQRNKRDYQCITRKVQAGDLCGGMRVMKVLDKKSLCVCVKCSGRCFISNQSLRFRPPEYCRACTNRNNWKKRRKNAALSNA